MKRNKHYCIIHDLSSTKQPETKCIRTKTILVLLQESRPFILVKYRYNLTAHHKSYIALVY